MTAIHWRTVAGEKGEVGGVSSLSRERVCQIVRGLQKIIYFEIKNQI